jgi:filamentous hemagglutinin
MAQNGWAGEPVDAIRTPDGVTTIDNTRVAAARELGVDKIPVRVHDPNEQLPSDMLKTMRFGDAKSWGEALTYRTARQKPALPPTGTLDPPSMPGPRNK